MEVSNSKPVSYGVPLSVTEFTCIIMYKTSFTTGTSLTSTKPCFTLVFIFVLIALSVIKNYQGVKLKKQ